MEESSVKRLRQAMTCSMRKLKPFREERMHGIRQMCGLHYGDNAAPDNVALNMVELGTNIYSRQVVARAPRIMASTDETSMRPEATDLEVAVNWRIKDMRLEFTLKEAFMEAMFCQGIVKVGDDYSNPEPNVFAMPVYFDDWIQDMESRRADEWTFCGNRYRLPLEDVQNDESLDRKLTRHLKPSQMFGMGIENADRSNELTRGTEGIYDEYIDHVELWDIWLPRERVVLTLSAEHESMEPLRIAEWSGPKRGPYHILGLGDVPGNALPLAPVQLWIDLHELINRLFNKLSRQADRQKKNTLVSKNAQDDGEAYRQSGDGEMLGVNNPGDFTEIASGGIDNSNFAFMIQAQQLLKQLGGNWDSLGGLGAQTDTYGQDKLIAESSSQRLNDIRDRMTNFAMNIVTDIAEYEWKDPITEKRFKKKIPGTEYEVDVKWDPQTRSGDFFRFNIDIEQYSMQQQTPATKLNQFNQFMQGFILPSLPMMQQQGKGLNFDEIINIYAKWGDMPELFRILTNVAPVEGEKMQLRGSPVTRRENVRVNRPGATNQGQEAALMQMLLGGQPQQAEMAAMGR